MSLSSKLYICASSVTDLFLSVLRDGEETAQLFCLRARCVLHMFLNVFMNCEVRNVCDCGLIEQSYQPVANTTQSKTERYVSSFILPLFPLFPPFCIQYGFTNIHVT